jgi:acetylornithine deacetylase/succinyl-diaminopimelate desuccinylase-like protein
MTTSPAPTPSSAIPADAWSVAHHGVVECLRDLIRIPSVNPPPADAPDGETRVARYLEGRLRALGLEPQVVEPAPGRGSVHVRLRGDGSGGAPFLLLSHLDVVPAPPERWTHDPFAADIADGYVYGRGAVDMKGMIALELGVIERLVAEARAAEVDPATEPIPGLRRDVLFTCAADEEAGSADGARWLAVHRPDWLQAAGAVNECGGVSVTVAGRRLYPIQVAEKGFVPYRIHVSGTWGHGSMPRDDNAAVRAARIVDRLAVSGPIRMTPVMSRFLETAAAALPDEQAATLRRIAGDAAGPDPIDPGAIDRALDHLCEPMYARALRALLRDTLSPNVVTAGVKYNVIPGDAIIEVDCRILPGTSEPDILAEVERRIGAELLSACRIERLAWGDPVETPAEGRLWDTMVATLIDHDPDAVPLPVMAPFATDAKATAMVGTPTYGFSPFRLEPDERFLERFHGVDERISLDALRFGLPVLYDVVRRFCG